jgi:hypothetical protein
VPDENFLLVWPCSGIDREVGSLSKAVGAPGCGRPTVGDETDWCGSDACITDGVASTSRSGCVSRLSSPKDSCDHFRWRPSGDRRDGVTTGVMREVGLVNGEVMILKS